jgi:hypothetical protein
MPPIALVVASRAGQQAVQRNAAAAASAAAAAAAAAASAASASYSASGSAAQGSFAAAQGGRMEDEEARIASEGMNGVSRKVLVATLKRRSRRARHCRSLPLSFLFFALFIWAMFVHVNIGNSFDVERG